MPSNSVPQNFGGMACPLSMSFGRAHGPQSIVAYMTVDGVMSAPLGTGIWMQIGSSVFVGFVSKLESNGDTTTFRAVDWRDRLQDVHYFAAFNMQESDGRFYHIPDPYWKIQSKVWLTRELIQQDFDKVQATFFVEGFEVDIMLNVLGTSLVSALTLMQWFATQWDFTFTAEKNAYDILSRSYPLNLDWNGGAKRGDVIQQLLERCGCQFTCYGFKNLHATVRGFTDDAFSQQFLQGFASYCTVGADQGSIGVEFNEKGRRVLIIGDRNKYELVFPCIINWNPIWTFELCRNSLLLYALLKKHGLTRRSKLSELPKEYHDNQTWDDNDFAGEGALGERKTRNDMEIIDYVEKVCFHVYRVVNTFAARKFTKNADEYDGELMLLDDNGLKPAEVSDDIGGLFYTTIAMTDLPLEIGWDDNTVSSLWPLSSKLVTDSNLQYMVYATSQHMIRGAEFPFDEQKVFVPKDQGCSIAVEEMMNPNDLSQSLYCVRVWFNNSQVWIDKDKEFNDPAAVKPDRVLVRLTLDAEYFAAAFGEMQNGPRVREQKLSVRNLYKAFTLNDNGLPGVPIIGAGPDFPTLGFGASEEVGVLRQNFVKDLEAGGAVPIAKVIKADDIAAGLAKQLLNHPYQLRSGNLTFTGRAGVMVDGVIESTAITFNSEGITEVVNLTSDKIDDQFINSPTVIRVSRIEKTEDDLDKDTQIAIDLAVRASTDAAKKVMAVVDAGIRGLTGFLKPTEVEKTFSASGAVEVTLPKAVIEHHDHKVGDVFIIKKHVP